MTVTVRRRDIQIEEFEDEQEISFVQVSTTYSWRATLDGSLSTGEGVDMSRGGKTSAEALANLEAAIAENGWEIR